MCSGFYEYKLNCYKTSSHSHCARSKFTSAAAGFSGRLKKRSAALARFPVSHAAAIHFGKPGAETQDTGGVEGHILQL